MAEAENIDGGDPYLESLNIKPARHINRQSQLDTGGKDLRKRGFNKLRVVVLEGEFFFRELTFCHSSKILCSQKKTKTTDSL